MEDVRKRNGRTDASVFWGAVNNDAMGILVLVAKTHVIPHFLS